MATPPPDYPAGPFDDLEDGDPFSADGAEGTAGGSSQKRRTRLRLMLAALPLAAAVALFVVTSLDRDPPPGPDEGPAESPAVAQGAGMEGAPQLPDLTSGAADGLAPPTALDAAGVSGVFPGPGVLPVVPGHTDDGDGTGADGVPADGPGLEGADRDGADSESADRESAGSSVVPTAPTGHRPVAVRIADPAALSLVTAGDRVDVVGMDGSVLAEGLPVLQDRSSGTSPVLVLAVPDDAGPGLAAAALSREVTVILSGEPSVPGSAP